MNETKTTQSRKHDFALKSRKQMSVDGVSDVVSFDEWQAVFVTSCGEMTVEGRGLHISVLDLDSGKVELDGDVDGIFYSDGNKSDKERGFFSRIFG